MTLLLILSFFTFWSAEPPPSGTLTITINNISSVQGKIEIGIYNHKKAFPKVGRQYKWIILDIEERPLIHVVKDLPHGYYAVAIYHDENSDGICNLNFLGMPTEGYGFSNNVKPIFRAPSFEKAKITMDDDAAISIDLLY